MKTHQDTANSNSPNSQCQSNENEETKIVEMDGYLTEKPASLSNNN